MSWTILEETANGADIEALRKAIVKTTEAGIPLYCSAADEGQNAGQQVRIWPRSSGAPNLAEIGASGKKGEKLAAVDTESVHYLFPGSDIPELTLGSRHGSSAATAYAAAFAGLIIWCFAKVGGEAARKEVANPEKLKAIFDGMKSSKYVNATRVFKMDVYGKKCMVTPEKVVEMCRKWIG